MQQRDPRNWRRDMPKDSAVILGVLVAALIVAGLIVFWPRSTNTNTVMRETGPQAAQRNTPAKPAQQPPAKPPAQ
jgi:hypothetical protein